MIRTVISHTCVLLGRITLAFLAFVGHFSLYVLSVFWRGLRPPYYLHIFRAQLLQVGYFSLAVVGITALCTGMVLALQIYTGFSRFNAQEAIATVVVLSMTRELGPVMTALMVAGRLGGAMAAELGTMRVTEQIDALVTLSTDPIQYLIWPRVLAGILMMPFLVIIADVMGVLGGYLVGTTKLGFNSAVYLKQTFDFLEFDDVMSGLIKACCFGFWITLLGCYHGYSSSGGAQGVGAATTKAVVSSCAMVLLSNYILTSLLFSR